MACLAIRVSREGDGWLGRLAAVGLTVSAVADFVIEWAFLGGLALFLAAHVLYVAAFVADERRARPLRALPFAAYAAAMYVVLAPGLGTLAIPIGLYSLAIAAMMWRAAARVRAGERAGWIAVAGALCFGLSDTLLALHRFRWPLTGASYLIMLTYWGGQFGIAASVVRSR